MPVLSLIPLLAGANSLDLLNSIQHPFWGFYYCLIARVAAERLALDGPERAGAQHVGGSSSPMFRSRD